MNDDWYGTEFATFGDRVEAARTAAGMSQGALARRLGVKIGTLKNWEQDLSEPRANKLQMMAGVLGVSLTWLLNGVGDGVGAPDEEIPADVSAALSELRDVRAEMSRMVDRVALLEKKLRKTLKETV